jgi:hypothetical protein
MNKARNGTTLRKTERQKETEKLQNKNKNKPQEKQMAWRE